jgi:Ca2+-dependent lipid-binding protein
MSDLVVTVYSARNLVKIDGVDSSEPFALLTFQGKEFKTTAVPDSQTPEWAESYKN